MTARPIFSVLPYCATICLADWPYHAGDGTMVPPRSGLALIEDPADARLGWFNPVMTGVGKASAKGYLEARRRGADDPNYGGVSNLVIGGDTLFCTFIRPSGDTLARRESINHRYYNEQDKAALPDSVFRIDADDLTIAIDALTGATRWTAVEAGKSINFLSNKRGHVGPSGAFGNGAFYHLGILGRICAYDADTGAKRWETTIEPWHSVAEQSKSVHLARREIPVVGGGSHPFSYQRSGLVVADDVLVAPDFGGGLLGLDPQDGRILWSSGRDVIHTAAVPSLWRDRDRTYLLCAGSPRHQHHTASVVRMIDPRSGELLWEHPSGANPGTLLAGRDHLLLNTRGKPSKDDPDYERLKDRGLLACYRISTRGLRELWRFPDRAENHYAYLPDSGRRRRAAMRDGILYIKLGHKDASPPRIRSFDLANGRELHRDDQPSGGNVCQPYLVENLMLWHQDVAHGAGPAGLVVYQLQDGGRFERLGGISFREFDLQMATGYEIPKETPCHQGRLYLRCSPGIGAVDLRRDVGQALLDLSLDGGWAGAGEPLRVRLRGDQQGRLVAGRVFPPRHDHLGIPLTSARRADTRQPVRLPEPLKLDAQDLDGTIELALGAFSWSCRLKLGRRDDAWVGSWTRQIPALPEPLRLSGTLHGSGGHRERVYPTPWLDANPLSSFGRLPAGWQRLVLTLDDVVPDGNSRRPLTVALDHEPGGFRRAVAGAFGYNKAWHEVDAAGITLAGDRLAGELLVILNPDPWKAPNPETGTAVAGRITVDARLGPGRAGTINGRWSAVWGEALARSGPAGASGP
jgi:outer membrane protein assembly factor BamB